MIDVDSTRCNSVATTLKRAGLPLPVEPHSVHADALPYDLATLNLVLVAVCHQTQQLSGTCNGKALRGWDYLQSCFQTAASEQPALLTPQRLADFSIDDLMQVLGSPDAFQPQDLHRRVALINDCGQVLAANGLNTATEMYRRSGTSIVYLLDALKQFQAYQDPVRKKSLFLLGLNGTTCSWTYKDPETLDPPVDYHEIRGHLRLGTVRITDDHVVATIKAGNAVDEKTDVAIRTGVTQAIRIIAHSSGFSPMQLHYAFWNLFRSVCLRGKPMCRGDLSRSIPDSYRHLVDGGACCFVQCCDSCAEESAIDEHQFDTDWY